MPSAAELLEENESLKSENAVLKAKIEWLQKQVFGGRKSEKLDEAQLVLRLGELEKSSVKLPVAKLVSYERRPGKARPTPAETFANLPVVETIEIIPEEVQAHPERYERIGEERIRAKRHWHEQMNSQTCYSSDQSQNRCLPRRPRRVPCQPPSVPPHPH